MCGIAGIVAPEAKRYERSIQHMVSAVRHRGPDGSGLHFFRNCALGHTRLAIVDLRSGHQPMLSANGKLGITFNGEIYGFRDIRNRQLKSYAFRTTSDTEVLLALYEKYGQDLMPHVPGMFAFAIWDDKEEELICARDRFGEKPFYFAIGRGGEFIFASELKAVLASGLIEPVLSKTAVGHYLQRQYVHPRQTIYENCHVLPPGHLLRYKRGKLCVSRYWELPAPASEALEPTQAADKFRALFQEAVRRQLVADVPVGAFLSGGLDSSSIVVAASHWHGGISTFSFDFEGRHSEVPYARSVARQYGTEHFELSTRDKDLSELLWKMQDVYDEPFADSSAIPTYLLSQEARRHMKVVLTGDGGDELLGGYEWYRPLFWMDGYQSPGLIQVTAARVASRIARYMHLDNARQIELRAIGMRNRLRFDSVIEAHKSQLQWFPPEELISLGFNHEARESLTEAQLGTTRDTLDDAFRYDIHDYMPGNVLAKIDRASMAHGLELRAPFLDVEFASYCIALPSCLKLSDATDKVILRLAFEKDWPAPLRNRPKQGFGAPFAEWLKEPRLVELQQDYFGNVNSKIYGLLPYPETRKCLTNGNPGQRWMLLVLAVWMEKHGFRPPH